MKLHELFDDVIIRLPKAYDGHFRGFVEELMDEYYKKVSVIEFANDEKLEILKNLGCLINGLKKTISEYYNGHPYNSYQILNDTINTCQLSAIFKEQNINYSRDFYRLRIKDANYALDRKDLFHIPFEERGKVKTQRYSIPGFPSLYLSNSIYVAWEELHRPKLDTVQAARFQNISQLNLIDLTTDRYSKRYKTEEVSEQLIQLLLWPLIMVCSIKVKSADDNFKPEFIIPQLLLQWVRKNSDDNIRGIKFSSTHIDTETVESSGVFFNIVIPVFQNNHRGYCNRLSESFKMTEVLSWQLYQFSLGAPGVSIKYDNFKHEIMNLELIQNNVFDYKYSPFSTLEIALKIMKLKEINFNE